MPLILFALSALVLTLEVLETKIFAYSLENSLIFLVIGTVLLGFGAGGSALALRKELGDPRRGNHPPSLGEGVFRRWKHTQIRPIPSSLP